MILILLGWGSGNLIAALLISTYLNSITLGGQFQYLDTQTTSWVAAMVARSLQGAIALVLAADILHTSAFTVRHRFELAAILGLQVWRDATFFLWGINLDFIRGPDPTTALQVERLLSLAPIIAPMAAELALCVYLAYRMLSLAPVLTRGTFLALFAFFAISLLPYLDSFDNFLQPSSLGFGGFTSLGAASLLANVLLLASVATFCIKAYMYIQQGRVELTMPLYLKAGILLFVSIGFWELVLSARTVLALPEPLSVAFWVSSAILYLGLAAICLFPLKLTIGTMSTVTSIPNEKIGSGS